jgi:hypothetical protein
MISLPSQRGDLDFGYRATRRWHAWIGRVALFSLSLLLLLFLSRFLFGWLYHDVGWHFCEYRAGQIFWEGGLMGDMYIIRRTVIVIVIDFHGIVPHRGDFLLCHRPSSNS